MTGGSRVKSKTGVSGMPHVLSFERIYNEQGYASKRDINVLKVNDKTYRNVKIEDFIEQKPFELGKGGNSCVVCYKHIASGSIMALKRTRVSQPDELTRKTKVTRDIEHLRKLRGHNNIITFYGCFEVCGEAYICMEKMEACFAKLLKVCIDKKEVIPTNIISAVCYAVSSALCFMKENKIIHRDIKPANMLLDSGGVIKLSDFGGSGYLYDSYSMSDPTITNCYAAPERIDFDESSKKFTISADVWSLGVSALELALQKHPFISKDIKPLDLMDKILNQSPPQLLTTDQGYHPDLANFIAKCLEKSPTNRPYPKQKSNRSYIMDHSFIAIRNIAFQRQVADWYDSLMDDYKNVPK